MDAKLQAHIYDLERQGRHADAQALRQAPPDEIERPPHGIDKLRALYAPPLLADAGFVGTRDVA